jgi:hypothetical protein
MSKERERERERELWKRGEREHTPKCVIIERRKSFKARERDKNLLINLYRSFKVFFAKNQRRNYLQ